jgi:hypothetical protein
MGFFSEPLVWGGWVLVVLYGAKDSLQTRRRTGVDLT